MNAKVFLCAATIVSVSGTAASAQTASAMVREADTLDGTTITAVNNSAVNGIGGYSFTLTTSDGSNTIHRIFGSYTGGAGSTIRSEGTIGDLQQDSFESFFGMSNASVAYSASSTRLSSGTTGLDGMWKDDTVVQNEEDPIGTLFSSFNSRPGITQDGRPYWVGGLTPTVGGGSTERALFFEGNILFQGGDVVPGLGTASSGSSVDFDFRFSEVGTNWLTPIDFDTGSSTNDIAIVLNGSAYMAGGGFLREDDAIPNSVGGLAGENWDNFDFMGINEAGDVFVTGDTNGDSAADEFVFQNGQIIMREGDTVGGNVLSGSIEGGFQNGSGDWGVIWDVETSAGNVEALIVNGTAILLEGDAVDWNGDGVIDGADSGATITNFTGISALTISDRNVGGAFDIAFTADVELSDGSVLEGGFLTTVPAPGTGALALGACGFAMRRRR